MFAPNLPDSYDYAYIRVVPRVERDEFVNVGLLLFCRTRRFLGVRIQLNEARLLALDPSIDLVMLRQQLALIERICAGAGPIGVLGQAETFHWLVAPHSTVVQCSPVHSGLCREPEAALERLFQLLAESL